MKVVFALFNRNTVFLTPLPPLSVLCFFLLIRILDFTLPYVLILYLVDLASFVFWFRHFLSELTESQWSEMEALLRSGPPDTVLVENFRLSVTRKELLTLTSTNWLSDMVSALEHFSTDIVHWCPYLLIDNRNKTRRSI